MCSVKRRMFRQIGVMASVMTAGMLFFAEASTVWAQESTCHIEVTGIVPEPQQTEILTEIHYRYLIRHDENCQIRVISDPHDAVICQKPRTNVRPAELTTQLQTVVDVFCQIQRPGHFFHPPVHFEVSSTESSATSIVYPKLSHVTIRGESAMETQSVPMENALVLLPWRVQPIGLWVLFFGLAVFFCGIFFFIYSRFMKHNAQENEEIPLTPIEAFQREVALLVNMTPVTLDEYKQYHDCLSFAMRRFISERFGLDVMSLTTRQLISSLRAEQIDSELCDLADKLLNESDYVKFARNAPSQADNLLLLRDMGALAEKLEAFAAKKEAAEMELHSEDLSATSSVGVDNSADVVA